MRPVSFIPSLLLVGLLCTSCKSYEERLAEGPLRLAFFPNVNHAQALVGQAEGTFAAEQPGGKVELRQFSAGPAAMEALLSGSVDAAYVGPGPAINAYLKAGKTLRVIAGAANGGSVLVTRERWTPAELEGKRLASPQLGNTQDIALRHWLSKQGLQVNLAGKGDVTLTPLPNPDILSLYMRGKLDGAWVPEPWGARLLAVGGVILVDERSLWPDGAFPSTLLVTTTGALAKKPRELEGLMRAHLKLTRAWAQNPQAFIRKSNAAFGALTRKPLSEPVLEDAFSRIQPEVAPDADALAGYARQAREVGLLKTDDVSGIVDGALLERVQSTPLAPAAARRSPPPER